MFTIITPRINSDTLEAARKVSSDSPFFINITPAPYAQCGDCHGNVAKAIKRHGGSVVDGWAIWMAPKMWIELEFHSVWLTSTGKLKDITPDPDGEQRRLFVRDPSTQFKGYCVPKVYHCISDEPHIDRAVHLFSEANQIRCKVKPGEPVPLGNVLRMIQLEEMARHLVEKSAVRV
jgi:hypothetical protein